MVVMVIDHTRDFVHGPALHYDPTDLAHTSLRHLHDALDHAFLRAGLRLPRGRQRLPADDARQDAARALGFLAHARPLADCGRGRRASRAHLVQRRLQLHRSAAGDLGHRLVDGRARGARAPAAARDRALRRRDDRAPQPARRRARRGMERSRPPETRGEAWMVLHQARLHADART